MFEEKFLKPFMEKLKEVLISEIDDVKKSELVTNGEMVEKVAFKELTTTVNIRGIFNGRIVISSEEKLVKKIGEKISKKYGESIHHYDALSELADIVIKRAVDCFPSMKDHAQIDMPITICSENGYMKNFEFLIWTNEMEFEDGNVSLSIVYSPGTGYQEE